MLQGEEADLKPVMEKLGEFFNKGCFSLLAFDFNFIRRKT